MLSVAVASIWTSRKRKEEQIRVAALSPLDLELHEAQNEHAVNSKGAAKELKNAQRAYDSGLKSAERSLKKATRVGSEQVASYAGKDGSASVTGLEIKSTVSRFR